MPKTLITFVMAIGMILTPIYLLSMLCQMFYGYKLFNVSNANFVDSGPRELYFNLYLFTSNRNWYLSRFCSLPIRCQGRGSLIQLLS
uniref:Uncharacterized protein n=1 Tax=Aegilops tauschii subsp. strangulata TaxID=200361 RepID=A0A453PMF9_AEGTS